jgi:hypothetical protein
MSPRHRAPVSRGQAITAAVVVVLTATGWGIWQNLASDVAEDVSTAVGDSLTGDFPGEVDVSYGSFQATTALFPDGMPDALPTSDTWTPWVLENAGLLAWRATVCVTFTGREPNAVWIDDIHVDASKSSEAAPEGLYMPPGGAGDTFDRLISIDLDDPEKPREFHSDVAATQTWQFPIWVNNAEPETPCILLETWDGDYTFQLKVDYRVGDESRRMTLDNHGEPFRLVGPANANRVLNMSYADPSSYTITEGAPSRP